MGKNVSDDALFFSGLFYLPRPATVLENGYFLGIESAGQAVWKDRLNDLAKREWFTVIPDHRLDNYDFIGEEEAKEKRGTWYLVSKQNILNYLHELQNKQIKTSGIGSLPQKLALETLPISIGQVAQYYELDFAYNLLSLYQKNHRIILKDYQYPLGYFDKTAMDCFSLLTIGLTTPYYVTAKKQHRFQSSILQMNEKLRKEEIIIPLADLEKCMNTIVNQTVELMKSDVAGYKAFKKLAEPPQRLSLP